MELRDKKLKNCPHCNSDEVYLRQNPWDKWYINCFDCEMATNFYEESAGEWLIYNWNQRK